MVLKSHSLAKDCLIDLFDAVASSHSERDIKGRTETPSYKLLKEVRTQIDIAGSKKKKELFMNLMIQELKQEKPLL